MRPEPGGTCYEYIAVYVDDLPIAAKDPQAFCNELKKRYNLKLKGVGPLEYHLGCTYKKDPDGTLAADPRRYVNKILESDERMFKERQRKSRPPLEGGDHPELDTSELCDEHQTKHVQTTHYVDANLHHDLATGKAATAVLHFLNQTPIDAYTKRQSTVETATYGSEFVAARTAADQIIDIHTILRYLGVPIRDKSYMFGDNRSVVTSSTIPKSTISKGHHLASYHRVREAIAAKYISFHWKDGKSNPADILSKHWDFTTVWSMLKPILLWRGDTATQLKGSDRIPSTNPGAEPPRDARDSGSARSHSMHIETSSSDRS